MTYRLFKKYSVNLINFLFFQSVETLKPLPLIERPQTLSATGKKTVFHLGAKVFNFFFRPLRTPSLYGEQNWFKPSKKSQVYVKRIQ